MRCVGLLALASLAACASGPANTSAATQTTRVVGGAGSPTSIAMNAGATASTSRVAFPLDLVWRALPTAYDSLKIPLTVVDPKSHHLGNEGMKIRQRLGTVALSKYIDCGQAQIGPSADTYDVYLDVTTTVSAVSAAETDVSTIVESAARPLNFGQEYSRCTSRGTIENAVAAIVAAKLSAR